MNTTTISHTKDNKFNQPQTFTQVFKAATKLIDDTSRAKVIKLQEPVVNCTFVNAPIDTTNTNDWVNIKKVTQRTNKELDYQLSTKYIQSNSTKSLLASV